MYIIQYLLQVDCLELSVDNSVSLQNKFCGRRRVSHRKDRVQI